jgi:hypothetical protein
MGQGRQPTQEELAEWRRRWDAVGPGAVAEALSSHDQNPLIDGYRLSPSLTEQRPLNTRPHAQEWLVDHLRRTKVIESRESWARRLTLAMGMITAIAAIIAATPVIQGWLSKP